MSQIKCLSCPATFPDYKSLALHILSNKNHRKGRKWAAKYIMQNSISPEKRVDRRRNTTPLTEQDRENKADTIRHLSGKGEYVLTHCPGCRTTQQSLLPAEYTQSNEAWRAGNGVLILHHEHCKIRRLSGGV